MFNVLMKGYDMKTYNNFNEMFSDNNNTNKNLSVFNYDGVEEVERTASKWAGGGKYGVYEIEVNDGYVGCVRFLDDDRVEKYVIKILSKKMKRITTILTD